MWLHIYYLKCYLLCVGWGKNTFFFFFGIDSHLFWTTILWDISRHKSAQNRFLPCSHFMKNEIFLTFWLNVQLSYYATLKKYIIVIYLLLSQLVSKRDNIRKEKKGWAVHSVNTKLDDALSRQMVLYHVMTGKRDFITIYMKASRVGVTSEKRSKSKIFPILRSPLYHLYQNRISLFLKPVRIDCSLVLKLLGFKAQCGETVFVFQIVSGNYIINAASTYGCFCSSTCFGACLGLANTDLALQEKAYGQHWWNHNTAIR